MPSQPLSSIPRPTLNTELLAWSWDRVIRTHWLRLIKNGKRLWLPGATLIARQILVSNVDVASPYSTKFDGGCRARERSGALFQ